MADSTSRPGPGPAASPLIQKQAEKDWNANKKSYTSAADALKAKHTNNPIKTGSSK